MPRLTQNGRTTLSERGQVAVVFALLIPMLLAMSGAVIGVGNWFVHAKHLQTKADAGALAGGGGWAFPCGPPGENAIDFQIRDLAHLYAGTNNPHVGGVPNTSIHPVLNGTPPAPGTNYYDDDNLPPNPPENHDFCNDTIPNRLEVRLTEDNTFPLASLIPLFPDIKRKATVELQEAEGVSGLLPIAVRAPEPVSMMAIFYNENNGTILNRKYFVKKDLSGAGLPGGLQGWSTENTADENQQGWARANLQTAGSNVVVAVSFRGACNTWDPTTNPSGPPGGITIEASGFCFEDGLGGAQTFSTVNELCNQGGSVQIANCYHASGAFPSETVQSGLHFIRSYNPANVGGNGPPELNSAYFTPSTCSGTGYGTGYFTTFPNVCTANLSANIDVGTCYRLPQGGGWTGPCVAAGTPTATETRFDDNVEVKYTIVSGTGNNDDTCDFGPACDLADSGAAAGYGVNGPVVLDPPGRARYAVGLRIRFKNTVVPTRPACSNNNFGGGCEWYFRGSLRELTQPTNATFFNDPVQVAFRGNTTRAGSIKWLRTKADRNPCPASPAVPLSEFASGSSYSGEEGSHPSGTSCFVVEVGLKGGIATDADNESVAFADGVGTSQLGYVDCTATGPQNIVWEIMNGCPPLYAPNKFNTTPFCPDANNLFDQPDPGAPFTAPDWPPLRCVKTRTTGQGSDLTKGLNGRFFFPTDPNPPPNPPNQCPPDQATFVFGRNYWNPGDNMAQYGYQDDNPPAGWPSPWLTKFHPNDPRLVVIFLTSSESFTGPGQEAYPVLGAVAVYITGYGQVLGNGTPQIDDPCAGPLPSDADFSGGNTGDRFVWGHVINHAVLSANATPSGRACNPGANPQVCVPVLVE